MPPGVSRARAWLLAVLTVLVALLVGGALFAILGRGPAWLAGRTQPGDTDGTPAFRAGQSGMPGVNMDAAELAAPELAGRLAALDAAGVRWVRFRLPWDQIEPAQGDFRWDAWDRVFALLAVHPELQPLIVLDHSPDWARPPVDAANPLAPPQTRAHFGNFAAAVARRYGRYVRYYQLWDEPNISPHWGARPVDPLSYLGLLREGATSVRAADPDAQIVLAALAPNFEAGGANLADTAFLDALYRLDGRRWFDIVAGEPYGFSQPPDAPPASQSLNFARAALLREVMVRHGDASTALWATAFGWNALLPGQSGPAAPWGQVTEDEQGRYAAAALAVAQERWSWLGPLFWAAYCPDPAGRPAGDPWLGFSLCGRDGSRRPAWEALSAASRPPAVLPPGDQALDHPALRYSKGWRVTPGAADPSANGERLTFTFYGTDLALRIQGGPFWAYFRISVDGQPANALARDEAGAAYLALSDPLSEIRAVPVARGLSLGEHEVVLENFGGWDQWALQGILVSIARPGLAPAALAWLALLALAALAWLAVAWPWGPSAAAWLERGQARAARWPPAAAYGLAALLGLAFLLSRSLPVDLVLYLALGLLFLLRPFVLLPLIAFAIPFWPQPKPVLRWQFSAYELWIWLGAAGLALRWLLRPGPGRGSEQVLAQPLPDRGSRDLSSALARGSGRAAGYPAGRRRWSELARWWQGSWPARQGARLGLRGYDWPVLALLLAALASTFTALRLGVALRELRMVFVDGALFYLLITRAGRLSLPCFDPWPLFDGLLAGMVVVSGLALWQLGTGQGRIDVEGVWRVRAFYGSPNNLALVLDRGVPLALAVALFGDAARPRRWLYALAAPVLGLACIATFSKGALLLGLPAGAALVVAGGAWRARRRWPLVILGSAALLAAAFLVWLFRTPRFADLLNFEGGTSFIRLKLWQGAWHMAVDHPWLGVGPDNFLYAYRTRYVLPSGWEELNLSHPHNVLLDLWTRLGLAGLAAGTWALAAAIRGAWRLFRRGSREIWPLALGLLGGLAATLAHGLIDNSLFLIDLMALFMLTLGSLQLLAPLHLDA